MTQRVKGLTVAFEADFREDDIEHIIAAIKLIKGVAGVEHVEADHNDFINRSRIKHEFGEKIFNLWADITGNKGERDD